MVGARPQQVRRVRAARVVVWTGLGITLAFAGCDSDDVNSDGDGGDAGAPNDRGSGASGDGSGGGEPAGGSSGTGGASSANGGVAGIGGAECLGGEDSTNCCDPGDDPCPEDWPNCVFGGGIEYCCDAEAGVRRGCYNVSDWIELPDEVCLDCDGRSFGAGGCDECTVAELPECEVFEAPGVTFRHCALGDDICKASDAGFVIDCASGAILCTCDPDA